ncbi:TetR/AcrR family transcriptional regulator [Streptomyces sp. NPDC004752]
MGTPSLPPSSASPRRTELLDACYAYLLEHGLLGLSLRPLAAATGTSPRVLLYLFGSKDELLRELLARARRDQMTLLATALDEQTREQTDAENGGGTSGAIRTTTRGTTRGTTAAQGHERAHHPSHDPPATPTPTPAPAPAPAPAAFDALSARLLAFLSAPEQRPMVRLTYEVFLLSLSHHPGPWSGFAAESVHDWLDLLVRAQPDTPRDLAKAHATRTLALIRGLLLDLLACEEPDRVAAAIHPRPSPRAATTPPTPATDTVPA